MLKRVGLFLLTNLLVVLTVSIIMTILQDTLGIDTSGIWGLAIFCGVFGMAGAFISLSISRWMAKRAYSIQLISGSERDPSLRRIYDMVAQLSRKRGLPMPEVGVYASPDPNAFATGPSKNSSLVAFSTGLISSMSEEEIEAVAAHEISHIANGDMVTLTLLTGVANALVMFFARIVAMAIDSFLRSDDEEGGGLGYFGYFIAVMLLETVFMALAAIPIAAFSRYREYRADAGSAKLSSPDSMIRALQTLGKMSKIETQGDSLAAFKISSSRRMSLWATHPPLEDRIKRLKGFVR